MTDFNFPTGKVSPHKIQLFDEEISQCGLQRRVVCDGGSFSLVVKCAYLPEVFIVHLHHSLGLGLQNYHLAGQLHIDMTHCQQHGTSQP